MSQLQSMRVGEKDIDVLVRQLWLPFESADWPVLVTRGELPDTHRPVESYAILPNVRRPRFLLPLSSRRAVSAAFSRHLSTGSARSRLIGWGSAAGWSTGLGDRLVPGRLTVGLHRGVPATRTGEWSLLARLGQLLEAPDLVGIIPVRRAMPNNKPTARLFTRSGTALGYAKIGWSTATRRLVVNETQVLRELDGGVGRLRTPRVLAAGEWCGLEFHIASPLPPRLGPLQDAPETMPAELLALSRSGTWGHGCLSGSAYVRDLRSRLAQAGAREPEAGRVLTGLLETVVAKDTALTYGRWHGDWVPWNLGRARGEDFAWDWEYSAPCVPVGFDLLHSHFQQRLARSDGTLEAAVVALDEAASWLSTLGVPSEAQRSVASLYLLEILTRAALLAAEGSGWNPRLYPALVGVASRRTTAG